MSVSSGVEARQAASVDDEVLRALLLETALGSQLAFAELYDRLAPVLHGLVGSTVPDDPAPAETTEAVFVGIWRRAARFEQSGLGAGDWVLAVAVGAIVQRRVRRLRRAEFDGLRTPRRARS